MAGTKKKRLERYCRKVKYSPERHCAQNLINIMKKHALLVPDHVQSWNFQEIKIALMGSAQNHFHNGMDDFPEFETYEDVIDSYNSGVGVEPGDTLTDYIKKNNIKIIEMGEGLQKQPKSNFYKLEVKVFSIVKNGSWKWKKSIEFECAFHSICIQIPLHWK